MTEYHVDSESTLDICAERFRAHPSTRTAADYRDVALDYWTDEMVGDETLLSVLRELRDTTIEH